MFDMGYTQYILIHLVKQEAAQEVRYALLIICSSMLLTGSVPLLWASSFSTALACVTHRPQCLRVSCPDTSHTEPESLRNVPTLAWVKSVQDSISSHAPSCLLISIFSAMSLQEACPSLCVSPTASRPLSAAWVCSSALKICELRCHRVLCQSAVLTGDELLT